MTDYSSTREKLCFSPRMQPVYAALRARLLPYARREGTATSPAPAGGKNPFLEVFSQAGEEPYEITLARAIVRSFEATPEILYPGEVLLGVPRPVFPLMEHFSWGIVRHDDVLDRPEYASCRDEMLRETERLSSRLWPLNWDHMNGAGREYYGAEVYDALCKDGFMDPGGYQGHTVCNYRTLLALGLDGMREKVARTRREGIPFYDACTLILDGMTDWLMRYAAAAENAADAETDPVLRRWYLEAAETCRSSAHRAPRTLREAAQLVWTLAVWDWVDCVGRQDQYLRVFFNEAVRENQADAEDVIADLLMKLMEHGSHNLTLSGQSPDGADDTCDLTYLMLQTVRVFHDVHPRLSVRVHSGTPKSLTDLCVQMWSEGMSDPTLSSDDTILRGLLALGVPKEDACDYSMLGCQEVEIPGKSNFGCEDGKINLARILEIAMRDGRLPGSGIQVGPHTGELRDFVSFEDFYAAFETQVRYFTKHFLALCDRGQEIRLANFSKLVKTAFTDGCLEKGLPHDGGGPIYNFGVVETAGLAAVSDSLVALDRTVFRDRIVSPDTLIEALDRDFEDFEPLRQTLLRAPKFGNGDAEADSMAFRVLDFFWTEIGRYRSVRGGAYTGACSLLEDGIRYGKRTGALPDGRHAGDPLGNTMGPRPGNDRSGLTSLFRSVSALPLDKGVGGTTLNTTLPRSLLQTDEARAAVASAVRAFLHTGGQMVQVTTADLDALLDAKVHPERHGDLLVRIGGYSVHFVTLAPDSQDEIISRYAR